MKKSEEYPDYRLLNDGTIIKFIKNKKKIVPLYVAALKDKVKVKNFQLEDFKKLFTIECEEEDNSFEIVNTKSSDEEKWRYVKGREWLEVSTKGRVKSEGIIQTRIDINAAGHPFIKCARKAANIENKKDFYSFTIWMEVIKFKYPDYESTKCRFIDGNKLNICVENLEDTRDAIHYYNLNIKKRRAEGIYEKYASETCKIPQEPTIRIKCSEFEALRDFNDRLNTNTKREIKDLKQENEALRKELELYRLERSIRSGSSIS